MGTAHFRGRNLLGGQGRSDPVFQEAGKSRVIDMLELAASAFGKVAARRRLVMRAGFDPPVRIDPVAGGGKSDEAPAFGHSVAPRGKTKDRVLAAHRQSLTEAGR